MKKVVSLLFLLISLFSFSAAWAFDVTFDATVDYIVGDNTAGEFTITKDGVSMHVEQGMANGTQYRFYKNKTVTFTSGAGQMTRIVFTCVGEDDGQYGPAGFTSSLPEYHYSGHLGIWTNAGAPQVKFTATYSQVRATKVVVTVGEVSDLYLPNINPASGTYYEPIEVNLTCITSGAKIYYTTDGSNPTTNSTEYTAPFKIDETTTVKAISAKDGEISDVAIAQYELVLNNCLGDLEDIPDGTVLKFNHEATAIYQYNNYLYLKDECGYGLVYGNTGQSYKMGDIIPSGWGGKKATYKGQAELTQPTGFQPATNYENILPEPITIPMMDESTWAHFVTLKSVIVDLGNQLLIDEQGNTCHYYPQFTSTNTSGVLDVSGIVTSYQIGDSMTYELLIIETSILPPPPVVCCLTELYEFFDQGQVVQFECPLTVIYQKGNYLYVKDSCGDYGLIYGNNSGGPFKPGDQIVGLASWTLYQKNKQLANKNEWTKIGETDPIEPIVMSIEDCSFEMVHWFVKFEHVKIVEDDDGNSYIEDDFDRILMYNRFKVDIVPVHHGYAIPYDANDDGEINIADIRDLINRILTGRYEHRWIGGDGTYDISGFLMLYKEQLELCPVLIEYHDGQYVLVGDVNEDGELNIADVNCIIRYILSH